MSNKPVKKLTIAQMVNAGMKSTSRIVANYTAAVARSEAKQAKPSGTQRPNEGKSA